MGRGSRPIRRWRRDRQRKKKARMKRGAPDAKPAAASAPARRRTTRAKPAKKDE
jgi:hypothetical protein